MVAPPSLGGPAASNPSIARNGSTSNRPNATAPPQYPTRLPYGIRRGTRLDLNTVERRNGSNSKESPKRSRPHGLEEAPIYRPSEDEFRDPMVYIKRIAPEASKYGVCKIIPPDNWVPDFAIDLERFHFRTRRQELNSVEGGTRTNLNYLDQLAKFHKQYGTNLNKFPSVDKRPLDLYKLKKAVGTRGGFDKVCKDKKWAEIGRDLGYSGKIMSSLSTSLKNSYQRWLHPYEEYLRMAKAGVNHESGSEHGSHDSHLRRRSLTDVIPQHVIDHPRRPRSTSPAIQNFALQDQPIISSTSDSQAKGPEPSHVPLSENLATSAPAVKLVNTDHSSATAASSSGFIAVNGTAATVSQPVNIDRVTERGRENHPSSSERHIKPTSRRSSQDLSFVDGPLDRSENLLKRSLSHDSTNIESSADSINGDGDGLGERRSKRLKRGTSDLLEHDISAPKASLHRVRSKNGGRKIGETCDHCSKSDDAENIVVCDACEAGYHRHCLDPPLASRPDYDWHCAKCLIGTGEYGFEEGGVYSLAQFQEKANLFKEQYFSERMPFDPVLNMRKKETEDDVESEFWRLVESLTETVEAEYGADIHSTTHGSGFPTVEKDPLNPYSKDPWNLNVLPFHEESLFRHIKTDISGMTVPWLYVGMCFSTFCWHNEDHYTYSANYQHFGATKTWYGIPGEDAHAFEEAMRQAVPELFEAQPDLLFQLVTLLPPDQLRRAGVNVYALDQRAGQFVITFPQAYHAGFNHGFNFNEAVNFAPADWEPFGEAGVLRLQQFQRQPCFSHDELLLTAASVDSSIKTARWLAPALRRLLDREMQQRRHFWARYREARRRSSFVRASEEVEDEPRCSVHLVEDDDLTEEEYQCHVCKAYTYLSQFICHQSPKISCLVHAASATCCPAGSDKKLLGSNHSLRLRCTDERLADIVRKIGDKAKVPDVWQQKLDRLLEDGPRPSLKSLHSLLTEGKKIPIELPGLKDLVNFVKRCDQWVEEAEQYAARKQQSRRKSEKTWKARASKNPTSEEKPMTLEGLRKLLATAEELSFSHEKIDQLQEKIETIDEWRALANTEIRSLGATAATKIEELLEEGRSFLIPMAEVDELEKLLTKCRWTEEAQQARETPSKYTLRQCEELVARGMLIEDDAIQQHLLHLQDMVGKGKLWELKTRQVMNLEPVNYGQLGALWEESQKHDFPINSPTLSELDAALSEHRAIQEKVLEMFERTKAEHTRDRPTYEDVRKMMKWLDDWTSKPSGSADLERELKRHEDWMRKGKKLFGKANAPLHILRAHMESVEARNSYCFDLNDTFRAPVEPQSREATPTDSVTRHGLGQDEKSVFCICRQPEGGMMIECDVCQDWYHGKCLKIARSKVKGTESFTCPICDWRVKIPRDAARPKVEDLQQWADEIPSLPFQPGEEEILDRIIDQAQTFRDFLQQFINGHQICRTSEEMPTILFYLRKLEGADVLLAYETNIFRQDVHRWQPIAPNPPPILEQSLSTRKPRPTKQQKMMKEMGVEKVEDLPPHMRKLQSYKRKSTDPHPDQPSPSMIQSAPLTQHSSASNGSIFRSGNAFINTSPIPSRHSTNGPVFDGGMQFGHSFGTGASSSYQSPQQPVSSAIISPSGDFSSNNSMRGSTLGPGLSSTANVTSPETNGNLALFSADLGMLGGGGILAGMVSEPVGDMASTITQNGDTTGAGIDEPAGGASELDPNLHTSNVDDIFREMTNEEPDMEHTAEVHDRSENNTQNVQNFTNGSLAADGGRTDTGQDVTVLGSMDESHDAGQMATSGPVDGAEPKAVLNDVNYDDRPINGQSAFDEFVNGSNTS